MKIWSSTDIQALRLVCGNFEHFIHLKNLSTNSERCFLYFFFRFDFSTNQENLFLDVGVVPWHKFPGFSNVRYFPTKFNWPKIRCLCFKFRSTITRLCVVFSWLYCQLVPSFSCFIFSPKGSAGQRWLFNHSLRAIHCVECYEIYARGLISAKRDQRFGIFQASKSLLEPENWFNPNAAA